MSYLFRAIWPITDETVSYAELCKQAAADLPTLIAQAHARVCGTGKFYFAPSVMVPGSGRIAETVLVYEAPSVEAPARSYWRGAA